MKKIYTLVFLLVLTAKIFAQITATFQPGSNGVDAHIDDRSPTSNFEPYPVINAGYNTVVGIPTLSHNLIQFDLSSIPTGATVLSATLSLYHSPTVSHSVSSANEELLAKVTQNWVENTVTWNTQPTYSAIDTIQIGNTNVGDDKPSINLLSFVQDWVNTPSSNYGMVMRLVDEPGTLGRFQSYASSDEPDSTIHPKLVVTYNLPCFNRTLVLQPGAKDGLDSHVDDLHPNNNFEPYSVINAGYNTVAGIPTLSHNFIQFDVSAIPAGSTIVSATLSLVHSSSVEHSASNANEELLAKVTQPWYENAVTWNTQPLYSGVDTVHIGNANIGDDKPAINLLSFVQDWVNNPLANYGMVMHLVDEPGSLGRFQSYASSDDPNSSSWPKLTVEWLECEVSAIHETEKAEVSLNIFPNPVSSELYIKAGEFNDVNASVYDIFGNKIIEARNVSVIHVNDLKPGLYLLIVSENGFSATARFIKE